ncbi:Endonuclease III [Candidatus Magnetaquicoccaceae bacterium FCR-1]|uniref:Endonuclease III n=1 Tax=Candidatus Magnetaquiglobus chichijimensis TaxID=3141448 RepID=A0ABQ0C7E1_9PROT
MLPIEAPRRLFDTLLAAYGPRHWWPARTVPEMMIGALLVQNTAWTGAERAVRRLEEAGLLNAWARLRATPDETLGELIRPAGFFRVKTGRLRAFADFMATFGDDHARLFGLPTGALRLSLLAVHGVGKETADAILCYAAQRPVFVVDAYTRRICHRLGWCAEKAGYDELQTLIASRLPAEAALLGEMHALLVEHAKRHCRARPVCAGCPVGFCPLRH